MVFKFLFSVVMIFEGIEFFGGKFLRKKVIFKIVLNYFIYEIFSDII